MLNKFTIIGIIIGSAISILGASSMVTSLNSPNEIQEDTATFGIGDFDKINFNAPANSSQLLIITGDSFDVKITTPDSSNDVKSSFKNKANLSWTSITAGQTIITIQNTGDDLNDYVAEGVEAMVPYKGSVVDILVQITGGIRSGLSYCGAHNIQQMQNNAEFIKMSRAGFAESQPHDVDVL